jgi:hypothetical protein
MGSTCSCTNALIPAPIENDMKRKYNRRIRVTTSNYSRELLVKNDADE